MEIKTTTIDNIMLVTMDGKLDTQSAPQAQEQIKPLLTEGCKVVFDMSACPYVSSAGLRILLIFAREIERANGKAAMTGLSADILNVMEMTGFDMMYQQYQSAADAVAAVK